MKAKKTNSENRPAAPAVYVESELAWCPQRHLEAEKLRRYLRRNGALLTTRPADAAVLILNTCALLGSMEERFLERIKELGKYGGRLVVTGCLKQIAPAALRSVFSGISLGPRELAGIDALFPGFAHKFSGEEEVCAWPGKEVPEYFSASGGKAGLAGKKHWFVQLSQGCETRRRCTYCAVWKSAGAYRSKPLSRVLEEVRRGAGKAQLHLMDSGAYGTDIGLTYPGMLREVLKISGQSGIFIDCINPKWGKEYAGELAELVKGGKIKAIRFAHQSGSDRILKLMNRPYTAQESLECVLALRKANPGLKLMTQFIVGFPSETGEDFKLTMKLLKKARFDGVEAFVYSPRPGTPASLLPRRVSPSTAARRQRVLEALAKKAGGRK
jgi:MiaB/RimO family radical SAM methylthiotransferase